LLDPQLILISALCDVFEASEGIADSEETAVVLAHFYEANHRSVQFFRTLIRKEVSLTCKKQPFY